jgi:hypothetical protein
VCAREKGLCISYTLNAEIAAGLRFVEQYRVQVQGRLTTMTDTQDAPSDTRKFGKTASVQAKEDADRIYKEVLDRFIAERQTATSQFESAILFIGETAGC